MTTRAGRVGLPRLLIVGSLLTLAACAAVASARDLVTFLAAHLLVGAALACQLTAGFMGVAAFRGSDRARAIGHVAGANALAWIVVNPLAGALTQGLSWRAAQAVPALLAVVVLVMARGAAPVPEAPQGLPWRVLFGDRSARGWIVSELLAYTCWAGLLTFVGAHFIQALAVREATAGWLLAAGAAAYFAASTQSSRLVKRLPSRKVVAVSALGMAVLLPALLSSGGPVLVVALFCLIGLAAGVRTPASSGIGLDQLPGHAGSMMAIRTAVTQLGYLLGAVIGGVVIAVAGYGTLGLLFGLGMAGSALLILRVRTHAPVRGRIRRSPRAPRSCR